MSVNFSSYIISQPPSPASRIEGVALFPRACQPSGSAADVRCCAWVQVAAVAVPGTSRSYHAYSQQAIVADVKEAVCRVADAAFDGEAPAALRTR